MADLIILLLILGYCAFLLVRRHQKPKAGSAAQGGCGGCCSGCAGCSGCGSLSGETRLERKRS